MRETQAMTRHCRRCGCREDDHQHYTTPGQTYCGRHPGTCPGFRPQRRWRGWLRNWRAALYRVSGYR